MEQVRLDCRRLAEKTPTVASRVGASPQAHPRCANSDRPWACRRRFRRVTLGPVRHWQAQLSFAANFTQVVAAAR
ncbi:unnamed protein product [Protopolystoma xenopodis]|uniref:Uncharacterized protein n=1 Tax=Protopolystoma xenopodis TaxID=117903 RepID=A0A3S5CPW2_9PLAT|nr:unnamed protein product [Protopolystoma xenopodis]